jgi:hypothetical protein
VFLVKVCSREDELLGNEKVKGSGSEKVKGQEV